MRYETKRDLRRICARAFGALLVLLGTGGLVGFGFFFGLYFALQLVIERSL